MIIFIFYCFGQRVWTLDDMLDYLEEELFYTDNDVSDELILGIAKKIYTPFMDEIEFEEFSDFRHFVLINNELQN